MKFQAPRPGRIKGLCAGCGKSTRLNIHQECGKSFEQKKPVKLKPYPDEFIDYMADIDTVAKD